MAEAPYLMGIDFGTGDDPYKRDWMERVRPRYRLTCWRPANPRNWAALGKVLLTYNPDRVRGMGEVAYQRDSTGAPARRTLCATLRRPSSEARKRASLSLEI